MKRISSKTRESLLPRPTYRTGNRKNNKNFILIYYLKNREKEANTGKRKQACLQEEEVLIESRKNVTYVRN